MFILDLNFIYCVLAAFDLVAGAYDCTHTVMQTNKTHYKLKH